MMTIRPNQEDKINVWIESTPGFPATLLVEKRLGTDLVRCIPADMIGSAPLEHDCVVAFRTGTATERIMSRLLCRRFNGILPSGYRIEIVQRRGLRILLVAGGDLFGMLAGLSDVLRSSALSGHRLVYRGEARTENPAFPLRYYWTWDHSTNWVLDDPGNQFCGCGNRYLKKPHTYLEDYRRLIDHCVDMRFNGIVIWGFLRDTHGGEHNACEIARYAADRGVAIMPGVGTTGYGGIYYEGNHPCNLETYLARNPRRGNTWQDGHVSQRELSPYCRENQEWIAHSLQWLYRSFPIGGVNMENSDLMVDHSPAGRRGRARIRSGEADYFKDQYVAYKAALEVAHGLAPQAWNTYATYSGFGQGHNVANAGADMGVAPYFSTRMPPSAIAQWTLSGMLSEKPLPLRAWQRSARPDILYRNPRWPRGLRPPTPRSAGFIHQVSQWHSYLQRSSLGVSTFAEACLRGFESGLEGISVHGEVTSRTLAWRLNYLAMRHWTYHPVSTLGEFAHAELAPLLGGTGDADAFVEILCQLEEGKKIDPGKQALEHARTHYPSNYPARGDFDVYRIWDELREWAHMADYCPSPLRGFTDIL